MMIITNYAEYQLKNILIKTRAFDHLYYELCCDIDGPQWTDTNVRKMVTMLWNFVRDCNVKRETYIMHRSSRKPTFVDFVVESGMFEVMVQEEFEGQDRVQRQALETMRKIEEFRQGRVL